ncbi:MAG: hypothetical protein AUG51_19690 [Acidobacteria bacterium 13_1_20CM_3_53_8]|nr:MAG: hypothetical protein AUG51_19690 [Acidobacteria bacterium 13_1_20CM_3_53_8]
MFLQNRVRGIVALTIALALCLSSLTLTASAKSKKKMPRGTPILWREPSDIASRNLYLGPGGAAMRPNLRRLTFISEETGGYSRKFRVRDASGREWVAKIGKEAQSETAAVRLLWAIGYVTEINYLAPRVTIPGEGTFENVRFEARPKSIKRLDEWKWEDNPFTGTRAFQGLKVMMALLNNWDMKNSNNKILFVRNGRRGGELQYIISDLGATFGTSGNVPIFWRFTRSRNNPEEYANASFLEDVSDNHVRFHYHGRKSGVLDDVTVTDARWIGRLLSQLSNQQIRDAFRAANYDDDEVRLLTEAVRERINELVNVSREARR